MWYLVQITWFQGFDCLFCIIYLFYLISLGYLSYRFEVMSPQESIKEQLKVNHYQLYLFFFFVLRSSLSTISYAFIYNLFIGMLMTKVFLCLVVLDLFRRWPCKMQHLLKHLAWCCNCCSMPPQLLVCNLNFF